MEILSVRCHFFDNLAKIEEAKEGDITFISNTRYLPWLYKTGASVIIVDKGLEYDKKN